MALERGMLYSRILCYTGRNLIAWVESGGWLNRGTFSPSSFKEIETFSLASSFSSLPWS